MHKFSFPVLNIFSAALPINRHRGLLVFGYPIEIMIA
jgi:hypothetical protein